MLMLLNVSLKFKPFCTDSV